MSVPVPSLPVLAHTADGMGAPCLLLNGGLMSMRAWDAVALPLSSRRRVIRCDLRGQLLSPGHVPATLEGHADEIVRLLDALEVEHVDLAGTSMGAFVAIATAATYPDRVRSLVAMNACECITPPMWGAATLVITAARQAAEGGDGGRVLDLLGPATFSDVFLATFEDQLAQRRAAIAAFPRHWFAALADMLEALRGLDLRTYARRVACPSLVMGAELDRTFPAAHSHALHAAFAAARLEIVPGAPHGMVVEQPAEVVSRLDAFWSTIDQGS